MYYKQHGSCQEQLSLSGETEPVCDATANVSVREQAESGGGKALFFFFFAENKHRDPERHEGSCSLRATCVYREPG